MTGQTRPAELPLPRGQAVLVGTGAWGVVQLPQWVVALRRWYDWRIRVCLTHTAASLVASDALAAASGNPVVGPGWPTAGGLVPHRELAAWADVVVVAPATAAFLGKLAHGIPDSLALAVTLDTLAPVVLAPSLPDGAVGNPAVVENLERLERFGFRLVPTVPGRALSDGGPTAGAMAALPAVLRVLHGALARSGPDPSPDNQEHP